jgi:hypothetical protein
MKPIGFGTPHTVARFVLDTSEVIEWSKFPDKYRELQSLVEQFRVSLARSDVVDTELDPPKNEIVDGYFLASVPFLELHGPVVLGHSRPNHSVFASEDDVRQLERVKEIVNIRSNPSSQKHDQRDAMHIATAMRYKYDGLITSDGRLRKRHEAFLSEFGFRVVNVDTAVECVRSLIQHQDLRNQFKQNLNI